MEAKRIMCIRLGRDPIYFDSLREASRKLGYAEKTIRDYINLGTQTKKGWSFDYALDEVRT